MKIDHTPPNEPGNLKEFEAVHMRMKIFTGKGDASMLEGELNEWLKKNPYITVKTIKQSYVASGEQLYTMVSLWYDN
ncbi:MAG: hypothetical protein LLG97_05570 [Deltaproteobacteria bacterium]|nr:hypothetical protein [Deltaproteobacteria bacterium]